MQHETDSLSAYSIERNDRWHALWLELGLELELVLGFGLGIVLGCRESGQRGRLGLSK